MQEKSLESPREGGTPECISRQGGETREAALTDRAASDTASFDLNEKTDSYTWPEKMPAKIT